MKPKGVNVIGVNLKDTSEAIRNFRKEFKLTMPLVMSGDGDESVVNKYGVIVFPTNLVLDKDGKVVAQVIGGDMEAIKAGLKKAGIK